MVRIFYHDIKCNKAKLEMIYAQDIASLKYIGKPWQSSLSIFSHMINFDDRFYFFIVLGFKPRASHMPGKHAMTQSCL